jgi:hypothetical protein
MWYANIYKSLNLKFMQQMVLVQSSKENTSALSNRLILNNPKIYTKELDVSIKMCRPKIIEQHRLQPTNLCRIETQPVVLTCKAIGYPSVEYQWYHNNKKIFDQLDGTLLVIINFCRYYYITMNLTFEL